MAINLDFDIKLSPINAPFLQDLNICLSILRLDLIHPIISGNKWFKLENFITIAQQKNKKGIITFGGAYSNHLIATAASCQYYNLKAIGMVRGEENINNTNPTLSACKDLNMQLHYLSRATYNLKNDINYLKNLQEKYPDYLIIPEGGYGDLGILGAAKIYDFIPKNSNIISVPIGSGTTISGIINASSEVQKIYGFTAMNQGEYLNPTITANTNKNNWSIFTDYTFGGFGKHKPELIEFIKSFKKQHHIELDFVYTAKMMFGIFDIIKKNQLSNVSICCIHTGGLQGNKSIKQLLAF